jgi:DNA-binding HxlR family transcriptional regulator
MGRTHKKVSNPHPKKVTWTPLTAARGVEDTIAMLEGRWKLLILFQLFGGQVRRFSDLERAIPAVTQKMLAQQLRQLEADGIITRKVYPEIPPKVEYSLTKWGQSLCPALDALLKWSAKRPVTTNAATTSSEAAK